PLVSLDEKVSESLSPAFSAEGYPRSDLRLIIEGRAGDQLVGSRSAAEYGLAANGAGGGEMPSALNMAAGDLSQAEILKQLGTGLYISSLWYLNYS
ncbi:metallopeptidase TldD-related protein, partial [Pseudomonas viridiflava]|uniref:metallopeptidase TldD-related protein n=1 Tax=Pseudomonas viridiflava TaxID=33069 RepID=UPI001FCECD21